MKKQAKSTTIVNRDFDLKAKKAVKKVKDLGEQASRLLAMAKSKYEALDPKTKKRILEGLAVTAGVVATAIAVKKTRGAKKTKKRK
jgi:hypothetical protein